MTNLNTHHTLWRRSKTTGRLEKAHSRSTPNLFLFASNLTPFRYAKLDGLTRREWKQRRKQLRKERNHD